MLFDAVIEIHFAYMPHLVYLQLSFNLMMSTIILGIQKKKKVSFSQVHAIPACLRPLFAFRGDCSWPSEKA